MKISVLGTGCPKCKKLAETVEAAAQELGVEYDLEKITDINDIMKFGVMMTPALAIDGKVVSTGKVLSVEETKKNPVRRWRRTIGGRVQLRRMLRLNFPIPPKGKL